MNIPIIFVGFLAFILIFRLRIFRIDRSGHDKRKQFWDREEQAMFTRSHPLNELPFIEPSCLSLPLKQREQLSEEVLKKEKELLIAIKKPMLNIRNKSNTDLKLEYGAGNLSILTEYEHNYNTCLQLVYQLGELLNESRHFDDAIDVLSMGMDMNTDISEHYILLAKLYVLNRDKNNLEQLIAKAENCPSLLKGKILNNLNRMHNNL